mmetsp:Transcript_11130/g.18678  ORF Transcript_11130/g.18678 Transcript_11130/m.18678 type:complete len:108 (+) Transcript_11130:168-491(+)
MVRANDAQSLSFAELLDLVKVQEFMKPFAEAMEPYKVAEFRHERGIPVIHDPLDCEENAEDPQCQHPQMSKSPMVGAGHHARAETNTPIIGILMQPVPVGSQWQAEF